MAQVGEKISAEQAFRLALAEAEKGIGFVSPNPLVGCTIVDREHRLLAIGYHRQIGQDHAEIDAVKKVLDESKLQGATFYVTLEPCAHQGRTPSCAKALVKFPLRSVVYGIQDPNPLVAGKGAEILRAAGIEAIELRDFKGLNENVRADLVAEAEELAEVFLHNVRHKQPFVAVKVATSLDGMMAMENGESKWITGEESREFSHRLRAQYDAVLIGRKTLVQDDPQLNVRLKGFEHHVSRVIVVDPRGKSLGDLKKTKLFSTRKKSDVFVVVTDKAIVDNAEDIQIIRVSSNGNGELDIQELLTHLYKIGIMSVFVEGGAKTIGHFLSSGLAQRLHLFMAPILMGGQHGVSWTRYFGKSEMASRLALKQVREKKFGADIYLTSRL